jgi:predicted Zn-ribbon and HTH transcriptional regulator
MVSAKRKSTQLADARKLEITDKIIRVLQENDKGLTALQIKTLVDVSLQRNLLAQLQKKGIIRQAKSMTADGRISVVYVLAKSIGARRD